MFVDSQDFDDWAEVVMRATTLRIVARGPMKSEPGEPSPRRARSRAAKGVSAIAACMTLLGLGVVVVQMRHRTTIASTVAIAGSTATTTRRATTTTIGNAQITSSGGFVIDVFKLLEAAEPTVVKISFSVTQNTPFGTQQGSGAASGVIISSDGLVLTNNHVISGSSDFKVLLTDGRTFAADVVGTAPDDDVGLLQLRKASGLSVAKLGSSNNTRIGELVFAIGNALDLSGTLSVTHGIISAKERTLSDSEGVTLEHLIQTDAAINSGNSGGPLIDSNGTVIGINTASISNSENLGFAIAIDRVKPIIAEIKAKGGVIGTKPSLGATTYELSAISPRVLRNRGITATTGVVITEITASGAADKAGLQVGDVITGVDGKAVASVTDLDTAIHAHKVGDTVTLAIDRSGTQSKVKVTLTTRSTS